MPLPFEQIQGNGVLGFSSLSSVSPLQDKIWGIAADKIGGDFFHVVGNNGGFPEPTSVLDSLRSPSPLTSSSTTTLSSSHSAAATAAAVEKCGEMGLEDLDGALSGSPGQEQSIFGLIMGDVGDPGSGFGSLDPGYGFGSVSAIDGLNPLLSSGFPLQSGFHDQQHVEPYEEKLQISNPETLINQNTALLSPPAKRLNLGQIGSQQHEFHPIQRTFPFSDPGQLRSNQPPPQRMTGDCQSAVIDQLFHAAEVVGTGGDPVLAQGILARLNHYLNNTISIGNNNISKTPFERAALHIAESLHSLALSDSAVSPSPSQPQNLIPRIAAYRAFSETSPFLQFVNFTANQAILESLQGFDRVHVIDFELGYGSQWASLMQELVGRNRAATPFKITAFVSPLTVSDEFELRFAEECLRSFAGEVNIPLEIELLSLELLLNPAHWPLSLRSSEKDAIAVNLPVGSVNSVYLPLILRFIRQISPNVVVSFDRGCDCNDAPFPNAVIHALQHFTSLLESIDAANPSPDAAASVERFWMQPAVEKLLANRRRGMERSPAWRSLFGQCGFTAASVSHAAEAQAECLVQRSCVRGFHVEKRQSSSSLVLCWQRKELVSVSAWRC